MGERVLVVDDSATVRRVVARTLLSAGYEIQEAVDGQAALDAVQSTPPDLVLVDFVMPRMNGLMFVQAMRGIHNLVETPVVLMSAKADRIGDGFLAQTGALDAIHKPFSPDALLTVVSHALARAAAQLDESGAHGLEPSRVSLPPELVDGGNAADLSESTPSMRSEAAARIAERVSLFARTRGDAALATQLGELLSGTPPAKVLALVEDLHTLLPGHEGQLALNGRLEHIPLGDVLQLLTQQRQTGVLEVDKQPSQSGRTVSICLREGQVDLALGRVDEGSRLGRYLLREELVDPEDLERLMARATPERGLLGARLVKLGYISPSELRGLLKTQTSERIYEALRWSRGAYRFVRFASRPEAEDARLGLGLQGLLMEGLRRVDEWRLIEEQIRSFDLVPYRDPEGLTALSEFSLREEERRVLDAVDGARTVRAILEESRLSRFDGCKVLFQMLTSRVLRVRA
ncbi:MAG: DUF4388 domain-containing protein [Sandaracinaceae bacterium]